jgi:uncharacterized protein
MQITFDPQKDRLNHQKHGLSLSLARELEWETLLSIQDLRYDYGEQRMIGYAIFGNRLYCVVYVDRDDTRRVISLRKANQREVKAYAEHD